MVHASRTGLGELFRLVRRMIEKSHRVHLLDNQHQHKQDSDDVRQEVGNGFRNVSWMHNYLFDLTFLIDLANNISVLR